MPPSFHRGLPLCPALRLPPLPLLRVLRRLPLLRLRRRLPAAPLPPHFVLRLGQFLHKVLVLRRLALGRRHGALRLCHRLLSLGLQRLLQFPQRHLARLQRFPTLLQLRLDLGQKGNSLRVRRSLLLLGGADAAQLRALRGQVPRELALLGRRYLLGLLVLGAPSLDARLRLGEGYLQRFATRRRLFAELLRLLVVPDGRALPRLLLAHQCLLELLRRRLHGGRLGRQFRTPLLVALVSDGGVRSRLGVRRLGRLLQPLHVDAELVDHGLAPGLRRRDGRRALGQLSLQRLRAFLHLAPHRVVLRPRPRRLRRRRRARLSQALPVLLLQHRHSLRHPLLGRRPRRRCAALAFLLRECGRRRDFAKLRDLGMVARGQLADLVGVRRLRGGARLGLRRRRRVLQRLPAPFPLANLRRVRFLLARQLEFHHLERLPVRRTQR